MYNEREVWRSKTRPTVASAPKMILCISAENREEGQKDCCSYPLQLIAIKQRRCRPKQCVRRNLRTFLRQSVDLGVETT